MNTKNQKELHLLEASLYAFNQIPNQKIGDHPSYPRSTYELAKEIGDFLQTVEKGDNDEQ
ncbi:MAG: cobalamin biosynthesis protein CbiX [Gammaproteobacteria bacterium]|jgi:hypothetical protein|nr:cobalamin biosynthesis protein CbiX [Gammaproteobacteria bacterium]